MKLPFKRGGPVVRKKEPDWDWFSSYPPPHTRVWLDTSKVNSWRHSKKIDEWLASLERKENPVSNVTIKYRDDERPIESVSIHDVTMNGIEARLYEKYGRTCFRMEIVLVRKESSPARVVELHEAEQFLEAALRMVKQAKR